MRWREKLFPGSGGRVLTSQWSCWFTFVSSTPLLKVVTRRVTFDLVEIPNFQKENLVKAVTRRVTYFLDEIPDFQSKIRGVGFLLPVSPAGRGWSQPLATSGCAALPGACAAVCPAGVEGCNGCSLKAVLRRGESVPFVLSRPFPIEGTGKERHPRENPLGFFRKRQPKIKQARLAADAPAFRVSRKKEWRGRSMKKFKLCCFLNSSSLRKEGSMFL